MSALTKDFMRHNLISSQSVAAVVVTSDANGTSVDMRGYNAVCFIVDVGIEGDTLSGSVMFEFEIEDSSDNSTFADAANADVLDGAGAAGTTGSNNGTFATVDANAEIPARFLGFYTGTARYVRPVINVTGSHSNGTPISIIAIRCKADVLPAV